MTTGNFPPALVGLVGLAVKELLADMMEAWVESAVAFRPLASEIQIA